MLLLVISIFNALQKKKVALICGEHAAKQNMQISNLFFPIELIFVAYFTKATQVVKTSYTKRPSLSSSFLLHLELREVTMQSLF